jgi:zinc protease
VHDRQIATDVSAGQGSREIAGTFSIVATAAPGHTLTELESAITAQVEQVLADGPTADEVARAQISIEADFAYRLQTVGGFGGRSDQLNAYNVYLDDPGYFDADLNRYLRVDSSAIQACGQRYLTESSRVAISVIPTGHNASAALLDSVSVDAP